MADLIEKVPAEKRWEIATKGLTGAYVACASALQGAVSEAQYDQFSKMLWYQGGKTLKELVDTVGLPVGNAREIEEALEISARTSMGPEFEFEVVEASEDRCVARLTKCAWHERWKEMGLAKDLCGTGHQSWGDAAVESVNPDFAYTLVKSMLRGDPYCEFVIERKR